MLYQDEKRDKFSVKGAQPYPGITLNSFSTPDLIIILTYKCTPSENHLGTLCLWYFCTVCTVYA